MNKKNKAHLSGISVEGSVVCAASSMIAVSKARSSRRMWSKNCCLPLEDRVAATRSANSVML